MIHRKDKQPHGLHYDVFYVKYFSQFYLLLGSLEVKCVTSNKYPSQLNENSKENNRISINTNFLFIQLEKSVLSTIPHLHSKFRLHLGFMSQFVYHPYDHLWVQQKSGQ